MTEPVFDHDRLDIYRLSINYVAASFVVAKQLDGHHRHARDQWLRAAQSIPLNIAEGNGKRSLKDRNRFLDVARGSAFECAAIQDNLAATDGRNTERHGELKHILMRIVSMLTRLIARADAESAEVVRLLSRRTPRPLRLTRYPFTHFRGAAANWYCLGNAAMNDDVICSARGCCGDWDPGVTRLLVPRNRSSGFLLPLLRSSQTEMQSERGATTILVHMEGVSSSLLWVGSQTKKYFTSF